MSTRRRRKRKKKKKKEHVILSSILLGVKHLKTNQSRKNQLLFDHGVIQSVGIKFSLTLTLLQISLVFGFNVVGLLK